jgi:hypothetical protein
MAVKSSHALVLALPWLLLTALANGCSGGSGSSPGNPNAPPPADIDPMQKVSTLTTPQQAEICDWAAELFGGYGAKPVCSSGDPITVAGSQQQCLAQSAYPGSCTATVSDEIACFRALATNPCAVELFTAKECNALVECML